MKFGSIGLLRGTKVSDMEGSKTYENLEGQPLSSPT